jgi:hypothetical protein
MRYLVVLALLAGCPPSDGGECTKDSDCGGGDVCARTDECLAPSQVREVKVTWMIRSMPATPQTCSASPDLFINFYSSQRPITGFAPVPCMAGQFSIDKLPRDYDQVEVGVENQWSQQTIITSAGTATLNLAP